MPTLHWIGKEKVLNHHLEVPFRLLRHESTHGDTDTGNRILHGDNLEALKALLPEYEGRVKCIYIDPPYNTGNEGWAYNDAVNDPKILRWLYKTVGKEGEDLSRHDKWLCMMYPRLRLLHKLLADDGAIFISIDDNEQAHLRLIMDEIFGAGNFVAQLIWRTDGNFDNQAKVKNCHEYILFYLKNKDSQGLPVGIDESIPQTSKIFKEQIRNTLVKNGFKNPISEVILPIGFPSAYETTEINPRTNSWPHYLEKAIIQDFRLQNQVTISSGWSSKDLLLSFIKKECTPVWDSKGQKTWFEISKTGAIEMVKERINTSHVISVISAVGSTQNMSTELAQIDIKFAFPKPTKLIEYLINFYTEENDLILDSFAGSGTTAHAVLNLNQQDGGNRKFILIEMEDYADTLTAERVRRVMDGYAGKPGTGGGFDYYTLGEPLFREDGLLNEEAGEAAIRRYVWHAETRQPWPAETNQHRWLMGVNEGTAWWFCYEREQAVVLDVDLFSTVVSAKTGETAVVYADYCTLPDDLMQARGIRFKKIPRDIPRL